MVELQQISALLLTLLAGNTLSANVVRTPPTEFRHLYTLNPHGRVVIQNLYGNVTVTAWDRDAVLVEAVKRSTDPKRLEDARIVVQPSADLLSISTEYTGADAAHPASVEYRITVPRRANLENVKLFNGGLSLTGLSGPVKASAVNGSIKALGLGGQVNLSTVNGRLEANFQHLSRANPISLSSVNGPILLSIPCGRGVGLVAQNRSGGIASDLGVAAHNATGHRLVVKGSGTQIRLHNVNGRISIHSSEHPAT